MYYTVSKTSKLKSGVHGVPTFGTCYNFNTKTIAFFILHRRSLKRVKKKKNYVGKRKKLFCIMKRHTPCFCLGMRSFMKIKYHFLDCRQA